MRSRSTTPTTSDVSSSDFSVLSPPSDPVDPLTSAMEHVDLGSSASDDSGYEIVVMPMSPASEHSEQSLFSVLSVPNSHSHNTGSESESGSDDSLSDSSEGASLRSAPLSVGGSTHVATPSIPVKLFTESEHLKGNAKEITPREARSASGTPDATAGSLPSGLSTPAAASGTSSKTESVAESDTSSTKTMYQVNREIANSAAEAVLSGSQTIFEACTDLTKVQRKLVKRLVYDAPESVTPSVSVPIRKLSTGQLQQRERAFHESCKAAANGELLPAPASLKFTKNQQEQLEKLMRTAASSTGAPSLSSSSGSPPSVASSIRKLTPSQLQLRERTFRYARKAAAKGKHVIAPSAPFTKKQQDQLDHLLRMARSSKGTPSVSSSSGTPPSVASSTRKITPSQSTQRERAYFDARKAAAKGLLLSAPPSLDFTKAQKADLERLVREAKADGTPSTASASTASSRCLARSQLSENQRAKRNRDVIRAAAEAVVSGSNSVSEVSVGFDVMQKKKLNDAIYKAAGSVGAPSTSSAPSVTTSKGSKGLNRPRRRVPTPGDNPSGDSSSDSDKGSDDGDSDDSDDGDHGDDSDDSNGSGDNDEDNESGYSTERTLTASDAASAINSDTEHFTSLQENKLLFWQALCIEFGLVEPEDLADLPTQRPPRQQRSSAPSPPSDSDSSASSSRSVTPTQAIPFPTSLSQAKTLLRTAHVPLGEYMALRKLNPNPEPGAYADLLLPSVSALRKALSKDGYAKLNKVKAAWLNPLLKDFAFHHSRTA